MDSPKMFLDSFKKNIEKDTELKKVHKTICNELIVKYFQNG